jgi:hypothetical protein
VNVATGGLIITFSVHLLPAASAIDASFSICYADV